MIFSAIEKYKEDVTTLTVNAFWRFRNLRNAADFMGNLRVPPSNATTPKANDG